MIKKAFGVDFFLRWKRFSPCNCPRDFFDQNLNQQQFHSFCRMLIDKNALDFVLRFETLIGF